MKKLPTKERQRLLSIGFNQCGRCLQVLPYENYSDTNFKISGWCFACMTKYHFETKKKTRSRSFVRLTPGELRRKKLSEAAGYRKCRKCSFTLPMAEFRNTPDVSCKKCSSSATGSEALKEYLARFNLQKCCTCKSIKAESNFYASVKTSKMRIVCKQCDKEHSKKWKEENPQRFKDLIRNVQGRRRARIRNLHHKPITGEEYEILRAQRIKIFGE